MHTHDEKEGLKRPINKLQLYSLLCLIRRSWPEWVIGVKARSGFHIRPIHGFAGEHQFRAPHALQDITGNRRAEDVAGEEGGVTTSQSRTITAITIVDAPEKRENAPSRHGPDAPQDDEDRKYSSSTIAMARRSSRCRLWRARCVTLALKSKIITWRHSIANILNPCWRSFSQFYQPGPATCDYAKKRYTNARPLTRGYTHTHVHINTYTRAYKH